MDPAATVTSMIAREVLLAPDILARAAVAATSEAAHRWMLCQPRQVRTSFVREVLDRGNGEREQRIWMLRQAESVRRTYLRDVAGPAGAKPEVAWMLSQPDSVRESYVRQVLGAPARVL
jgi:hypothetical protein